MAAQSTSYANVLFGLVGSVFFLQQGIISFLFVSFNYDLILLFQNMENNNVCRLCFKLKSTKHLINIFDKNKCAIKSNIAEVLSTYFWFKVSAIIKKRNNEICNDTINYIFR